jgi:hypothetical protein
LAEMKDRPGVSVRAGLHATYSEIVTPQGW